MYTPVTTRTIARHTVYTNIDSRGQWYLCHLVCGGTVESSRTYIGACSTI